METDSIPQQAPELIESADLVVSILAEFDADFVTKTYDALRALPVPLRIAVVDNEQRQGPPPISSEAAEKAPWRNVPKRTLLCFMCLRL